MNDERPINDPELNNRDNRAMDELRSKLALALEVKAFEQTSAIQNEMREIYRRARAEKKL